jgi:hypothetical protein
VSGEAARLLYLVERGKVSKHSRAAPAVFTYSAGC